MRNINIAKQHTSRLWNLGSTMSLSSRFKLCPFGYFLAFSCMNKVKELLIRNFGRIATFCIIIYSYYGEHSLARRVLYTKSTHHKLRHSHRCCFALFPWDSPPVGLTPFQCASLFIPVVALISGSFFLSSLSLSRPPFHRSSHPFQLKHFILLNYSSRAKQNPMELF